jgi:hypothetical protein
MIVLAVLVTMFAVAFSFIVWLANGMRSAPGPLEGRGLIAAAWAIAGVFWLAWWFN